jgi:succinyl-CoA synthetase alpha subunit
MAILIDETTLTVIQGITGQSGRRRVRFLRQAGTALVAGVTPGRRGETVEGVPVYHTVREAAEHHPGLAASLVLVPPAGAKEAVLEAIEAGIRVIVLTAERMPQQDTMEIIAASRSCGAFVVGPNSPGIIAPGRANLGGLGGRYDMMRLMFREGRIGLISRSGGNAGTLGYYLAKAGLGVSTGVGVGGDAFTGCTWTDLMERFEADPETDAVIAYGEIGGVYEENAAAMIAAGKFTKPFVAYIGGRNARAGMRFGHAGALIARGSGDAEHKRRALREAGATVVDHLDEIGAAMTAALARAGLSP